VSAAELSIQRATARLAKNSVCYNEFSNNLTYYHTMNY